MPNGDKVSLYWYYRLKITIHAVHLPLESMHEHFPSKLVLVVSIQVWILIAICVSSGHAFCVVVPGCHDGTWGGP